MILKKYEKLRRISMIRYKNSIFIFVFSLLFLSFFSFKTSYARSCHSYFEDSKVKKASSLLINRCKRLAVSGVGVSCAVLSTVLTAGAGAPLGVFFGSASIGIVSGEIAYDGSNMGKLLEAYLHDKKINNLLLEAQNLIAKEYSSISSSFTLSLEDSLGLLQKGHSKKLFS